MSPWFRALRNGIARRMRPQARARCSARLRLEALEERTVPSTLSAPAEHVLLLSVDGLHQADVADPNLAPDMPNTPVVANFGKHRQDAGNEHAQAAVPYAVWISRLLFEGLARSQYVGGLTDFGREIAF